MTARDIPNGHCFSLRDTGEMWIRDSLTDGQSGTPGYHCGVFRLGVDGVKGQATHIGDWLEVSDMGLWVDANKTGGFIWFPVGQAPEATKVDRGLGKECKHCKRPNPIDKNGQLVCWWCSRVTT